jgi:hypothetical protein
MAEAEILERISFVSHSQGEHSGHFKKIEELLEEQTKLLRQLLKTLTPSYLPSTAIVVTPVEYITKAKA